MPLPDLHLTRTLKNLAHAGPMLLESVDLGNVRALRSMLGPAWRGLVQQRGKREAHTAMRLGYSASFDWGYLRDQPELTRLYEVAKGAQWNGTTDLDWTISVDPENPERPLLPLDFLPVSGLASFQALPPREQALQAHATTSWLLSQFLHGEQGALFAACQVTEAVPWMDAKLYGSSQVADEGRHVEVFHRYLDSKLQKRYEINDNLYVVIDALMSDNRWDLKFLGMQIMIEGLALGAFGFIQKKTQEPLLKQLLRYVIADEARHVHFGVLALQRHYQEALSDAERREREEWAFEVAVLLRNRFYAHELWEERYAAQMSRKQWDEMVSRSEMMKVFRHTMFKRLVPNLKRIGLLSERMRPRYQALGLLEFEHLPAAPELTAKDLLDEG